MPYRQEKARLLGDGGQGPGDLGGQYLQPREEGEDLSVSSPEREQKQNGHWIQARLDAPAPLRWPRPAFARLVLAQAPPRRTHYMPTTRQ